ncbi:putative inorganic phosphate cotransporter [Penaeus japonicus]|uniref:putative inorganic phosphate cotransporter n=1 Tax=Penaeus japonicus TaxID=27405 RepID=UPI001C715E2D|nr:putative inorganic phosphate cotransporter [Penaeus japonicus]
MVLGVAHSGCNWKATVILICLALFCNGAVTASIIVNHTDIAPNFSGTLLGMDNTSGSIVSFVVPVVIGVMTKGQQTLGQWQKVFWICVPIYTLAEIFYLIFSSGTVQPWNSGVEDQSSPDQLAANSRSTEMARLKQDQSANA